MESNGHSPFKPIAIIGLGCRLPGAPDVGAYWRMLLDGVDAIREVPEDRWKADAVYDPHPAMQGKTVSRHGGFLTEIDLFDPYFFGISPREAIRLDPQQRLLLEVTWEAIENAGIPRSRFVGSRTGVFIGVCTDDYITLERLNPANIDMYVGTGGSRGSTAGRLSFAYGLTGPTMAVDTACSSSLVALHAACNSLQEGDCEMALAGGVNVILHPGTAIAFSQANMLSPDGRCKAFDSRANGFVRSEGAGVVILKPLARAIEAGDPIYAVIRGTASNNDGSSSPFMTPSRQGQAALLRHAYERAGVAPQSIQYVEAHGTGTAVGDPVEIGAISDVIAVGRSRDQACIVGSCKTNIGHGEAAAGVAGLIKTVLCLQHKVIPPNLHFLNPNPNIPWEALPISIPTQVTPWPLTQGPARAGVNSFGISGTNAHVVLEESPAENTQIQDTPQLGAEVLCLSGHTPDVLKVVAASYQKVCGDSNATLHDLCYSAAVRRTHHEHGLAVVGSSREEIREKLESFLVGDSLPGINLGTSSAPANGRPVFVFSGIGSHWPGMGGALRQQEPVFEKALLECDRAIRPLTGWSVIEEIDRPAGTSRLDRIDVMQPAIFSMQVALASLWRSWGVEPAAVVGHSLGEIAAAHVAGALSLEEAALVVCNRSRLMHATSGLGAMAAIGLPIQEVEKILEPFGNQVCIAALNAPESCTISGDRVAIDAILAQLNAVGVFCRPVRTEVACHSAQMAPLQEQLAATVAGLSPKTETVPLFSTLLGRQASGLEFGAVYWPRNLREPVRFAAAVGALLDEGYCRFIEVSPSPALVSSLRQNAQQRKIDIAATHSLRRAEDERSTLLNALGEIYVSGYDVDWQRLYPSGKFVAPPPYTWQRERFWFEQKGTSTPWGLAPVSHATKYSSHPLLGLRWESAHHPNTHFYEVEIDLKTLPFLGDHRADGTPIFPAAAYVEMALAASIEVFGPGPRVFRDVRFKSALFLSREHTARLQLVLTCDKPEQITFTFYSQETAEHGSSTWLEKATGQIDLSPLKKQPLPAQPLLAELLDQQYPLHVPGDQFYAGVAAGIEYGPAFHCVQHAWKGDNRAVTSIALPEATHADAKRYHLPPVLLDGFLHSIYACSKRGSRTSLPFEMSRMEIWRLPNPATHLWCELTLEKNATECESFLTIFDDSGEVLIRINRYRSKFLETKKAADKEEPERWLYERQWRVAPPQQARVLNGSWLIVGGPERAATELKQALEAQQQACVLIARGADFASALREFKLSGKAPGIIFFEALDLPANPEISLSALDRSVEHTCGSLLQLLHGLAGTEWLETPRLFVVTRNAQEVGTEPRPIAIAQAPLVGMARVAAVEHREFQITEIDTEAETAAGTIAQEVLFADQEMEVALRNGQRWGVRLVRPNLAERSRTETFRIGPEAQKSFQLEAAGTGLLDDLKLRGAARRSPEPGEVEIHVKAVGLNFLDVLKALNMAPGLPSDALYFGMECAGVVVAVGDGVERLRVGDEVVALDSTITGCFRAFFTTRADSVFSKPAHLSLEEAVTIPVAYQTAYYALCCLGRMQKGESVLIHSAAGGVGMAALDLARQTGAVIFATAGTQEKRDLLRQLGAHYVMDSHSLRFADEVMQHTQGRGVDLVLNSLAGEAIPKSLSVLATGGRFLEIGKRDIYADSRIGLLPFQRNLSFFAIDLLRMRLERPEVVQSLTREVAQRLADGTFKPLPYTRFPASSVADAFRYMAQGKHTGKIVVTLDDGAEAKVETTAEPVPIRADAAYLITGGTGGLGLVFARRLVAQGARNLVLVSRRGPSPEAEEQINSLRAEGANILTIKADISDPEQVSAVLAQIESLGLPLKGVLHLAGVLNDGILQQQTWEKFQSVLPPKIAGAWNLHSQLSNTQLDFFVLFSSAASVLGGAGQSNYAAGNAFLDALAFYRRQSGLAALSINWGPWADVGMAAMKEDRGSRLAENGMGSIPPEEGAELLDTLLQQPSPQVAVMPIDWKVWAERFPDLLRLPMLSELADDLKPAASQSGEQSVQQMVAAAGTQTEALELLQAYLRKETAKILRVPEARLDPKVSLIRFGLDSLMAIELKNRIETSFAVRLATTKLLQGPTVTELAEWLSKEVRGGESAAATAAPVRKTTEMSVRVEELSEEEVDSMLKDFLTAGGDA